VPEGVRRDHDGAALPAADTPIQVDRRRVLCARATNRTRLTAFGAGRTRAGAGRRLRVDVRHYDKRRPHRALDLRALDPRLTPSARGQPARSAMAPRRRDLLGGLIDECEAAAA
jgi:hypothetical protein